MPAASRSFRNDSTERADAAARAGLTTLEKSRMIVSTQSRARCGVTREAYPYLAVRKVVTQFRRRHHRRQRLQRREAADGAVHADRADLLACLIVGEHELAPGFARHPLEELFERTT